MFRQENGSRKTSAAHKPAINASNTNSRCTQLCKKRDQPDQNQQPGTDRMIQPIDNGQSLSEFIRNTLTVLSSMPIFLAIASRSLANLIGQFKSFGTHTIDSQETLLGFIYNFPVVHLATVHALRVAQEIRRCRCSHEK